MKKTNEQRQVEILNELRELYPIAHKRYANGTTFAEIFKNEPVPPYALSIQAYNTFAEKGNELIDKVNEINLKKEEEAFYHGLARFGQICGHISAGSLALMVGMITTPISFPHLAFATGKTMANKAHNRRIDKAKAKIDKLDKELFELRSESSLEK